MAAALWVLWFWAFAPFNYRYDGVFIVGCSMVGRKIDVLREQPLACFQVDETDGDASWRSVIVEGVYEELTDEHLGTPHLDCRDR